MRKKPCPFGMTACFSTCTKRCQNTGDMLPVKNMGIMIADLKTPGFKRGLIKKGRSREHKTVVSA